MTVPSRQEMFNRAWRGLKEQGFESCVNKSGHCVYRGAVKHDVQQRCAWGHVDPAGTEHGDGFGAVGDLAVNGFGLAGQLDDSDLAWARALQVCHDTVDSSVHLETRLRAFAAECKLKVPR